MHVAPVVCRPGPPMHISHGASLESLRYVLRLVRKVASHIVVSNGNTSELMAWLGYRSAYRGVLARVAYVLGRLVACHPSL